ncbi:hypothetical protein SASPL_119053 [Salvia splendens]|uniref:Metallo-beta-lactamase domain-containing protein n=1 Tax=Salvia splendens TaxID=180675 RepID=A0A8X8XXV8_SALSN|nr:hypothetical protein SASPL_119053 [Salvia splendens]
MAAAVLTSSILRIKASSSAFSKSRRVRRPQNVDGDLFVADVEIKLEGNGPWTLGSDITLIHTPGHTKGSVCLLDKTRRILFTGDHLLMDEFGWSILDQYNWFSVTEQLKSVQKLVELDFEWILPGHGRRASFQNAQEKDTSFKAFLAARGFQG